MSCRDSCGVEIQNNVHSFLVRCSEQVLQIGYCPQSFVNILQVDVLDHVVDNDSLCVETVDICQFIR